MKNSNPVHSTSDNEGLSRVLGACAFVGVGLAVATLFPAASPLILGRCAFEAGRVIGRR